MDEMIKCKLIIQHKHKCNVHLLLLTDTKVMHKKSSKLLGNTVSYKILSKTSSFSKWISKWVANLFDYGTL